MHEELTYSAESAGRMDIGETWELQSQRGEKDNLVRTLRRPGFKNYSTVTLEAKLLSKVNHYYKNNKTF